MNTRGQTLPSGFSATIVGLMTLICSGLFCAPPVCSHERGAGIFLAGSVKSPPLGAESQQHNRNIGLAVLPDVRPALFTSIGYSEWPNQRPAMLDGARGGLTDQINWEGERTGLMMSGGTPAGDLGAVSSPDSSEISGVIVRYYAAYSAGNAREYQSLLAEHYLLLENGEILDAAGDLKAMPKPSAGHRRRDAFDFRSVTVKNDIAYAIYFLKSEILDERGSRSREWLESAILEKSAAGWRMALLHSTRINR